MVVAVTTQIHVAVALVAAHLLGDFVLQTKKIAERKTSAYVLLTHALIVAALSYGLAGAWIAWEIFAVILITHAFIDFIKVKSKRRGLVVFTLDQLAHVAVIVALIQRLDLAPPALHWVGRFGENVSLVLVVIAGAVAATRVAGVVIGIVVLPFRDQFTTKREDVGFLAGGETIGYLERFLILVFVLAGELGAIGFLIAAKSILRFGELRDGHRKETEYVIIGTMWSFACGLVVALAVRALLDWL